MKTTLGVTLILLALFFAYFIQPGPNYVCQFGNMTSKFQATEREAKGDSFMVTVSDGERTFMFRGDRFNAYTLNEDLT